MVMNIIISLALTHFTLQLKLTCSLYQDEVSKSKALNEMLGVGVGLFQGLSNLAINGLALVVLYYGGSLLAAKEMEPGDLMSFLVATQTIQRYFIGQYGSHTFLQVLALFL